MATILVADDEKNVRDFLKALLISKGYRVILAIDGIEAITLAESVRPDCAIVDLTLPPTEGITVSENLKKLPGCKDLPIMIYTGRSDIPPERQKNLVERFGAFLEKPAETNVILDTVALLLKKSKEAKT